MAWSGDGQLPCLRLMLPLSVVVLALAVLMLVRMPVEKAAALASVFGLGHADGAGLEPVEAMLSADEMMVGAPDQGTLSPAGALCGKSLPCTEASSR